MSNELIVDEKYLKGFNHGYAFAEHEPQFAKMLTQSNVPVNEYFTGFKAGKETYAIEKIRERVQSKSKISTPDKTPNKNKGRTK